MSKNKDTKKGLALGAIFGLIAGLFSAMPASAAPSTTAFTFDPAGAGTSFVTFVDEDFTLLIQRDSSVVSATDYATLKYDISFNSGTSHSFEVIADTGSSAVAISGSTQAANFVAFGNQAIFYGGLRTQIGEQGARTTFSQYVQTNDGATVLATQSWVVAPSSFSSTVNNRLSLRIIGENGFNVTTMSPSVVATIRPFLDLNSNNVWDSGSEPSAVQTVTFASYASLAPTATVTKGIAGDNHVTASIALPAMNYGQLSGKFFVKWTYAGMNSTTSAISLSAQAERTITDANYLTALSASLAVTAAQLGASWSASVGYVKDGLVFTTIGEALGIDQDFVSRTWGIGTAAAQTRTIADVGIYVASTSNQTKRFADSNVVGVRPNATYVLQVTAQTASQVSVSAAAIRLDFGGTSLSTTKTLAVNGGLASTGSHAAVTVTTGTNGIAEVTLVATGFSVGENIVVTASQVGTTAEGIILSMEAPSWKLKNASDLLTTTPGTALNVTVSVLDQWDALSSRTDQRVKFTKGATFDDANTISYAAVSAGKATVTITPSPATLTGSFVLSQDLQTLNQNTGVYDATTHTDDADGNPTIYVTGASNGFRAGLAASYSASISYGVDYSWSSVINAAYVVITGSPVVVSSPGLMFLDGNDATNTGTDSLTLVGDSAGQVKFKVTARLAGTYTVTLTAGSATTTSLIVVNSARSDMGTTITWDTTAIEAGRTKIVVGTLTDANGNPVYTDGPGNEGGVTGHTTASILVTYAGTAGIPVGSMPTETDADGKFRVSVLTSAADDGAFTLTAVYSPYGSVTATADKVTSVNSITVGDGVVATDQKITVGTFKGYIAIYTKGYEGQKLSAKVAGKWLVQDPIVAWQGNDYSRVVRLTGAGYTILVHLYIDGVFVRSETIVTK
jgi:hypothetical protein